MAASLAVGRPPTACRQCKQQKVRCSGDYPRCRRCSRSDISCVYPQGRVSRKRTYFGRPSRGSPNDPPSLSDFAQTKEQRKQGHPALLNDELTILQSPDYLGIPEIVISDLVDTYFSHQYNARLLLHKATFQQERQRGTIRPHVLLAICAAGALFYKDERGQLPFRDFSLVWAERAGKLVLNEVEVPHEDNIITFATLTLFWYMLGSWRRSYIHKGNAMQTAHVLNLANENKGKGGPPLERELSRRRFWACYLTNCHTSNSMFSVSPAGKIDPLPLPWRESEFETGAAKSDLVTFGSGLSNGGIYSELIKAMTHWSSVDSLMKTAKSNDPAHITTIHQRDADIRKWWAQLPPNLHLNLTNLSTFRRVDLTKLLLIHVIYHQCLCALHASIVPLFTWGPDQPTQVLAQQFSAQLAYENACATSRLFEMVLHYNPDTSDFPSFLGYAAYCSYAVQVPFKWCLDSPVRETAQNNTAVNLGVIQSMGRYWKFIGLLGNYAQYLHEAHSQHQFALDGEPKVLSSNKLSGFRITAARARASILSMNGILWKDDGCIAQGDDLEDLGLRGHISGEGIPVPPTRAPGSSESRLQDTRADASFADENASTTTLHDGPPAISPGLFPHLLDEQPLSFFHPFLCPSNMLGSMPDNLGSMDYDGMDVVDSWDDYGMSGDVVGL